MDTQRRDDLIRKLQDLVNELGAIDAQRERLNVETVRVKRAMVPLMSELTASGGVSASWLSERLGKSRTWLTAVTYEVRKER